MLAPEGAVRRKNGAARLFLRPSFAVKYRVRRQPKPAASPRRAAAGSLGRTARSIRQRPSASKRRLSCSTPVWLASGSSSAPSAQRTAPRRPEAGIPPISPARPARTSPSALSHRPPAKCALTSVEVERGERQRREQRPGAQLRRSCRRRRSRGARPSPRPRSAPSRLVAAQRQPRPAEEQRQQVEPRLDVAERHRAELRLLERARPQAAARLARGEAAAAERRTSRAATRSGSRATSAKAKAATKKTARPSGRRNRISAPAPASVASADERAVGIGLRAQPLDDEAAALEPRRASRTGPAAARRRSATLARAGPCAAIRAPVKPASAAVRPIRLSTGSAAARRRRAPPAPAARPRLGERDDGGAVAGLGGVERVGRAAARPAASRARARRART